MAMNRQQLRLMAAKMRYEAKKKKPTTRKQAQAWLAPIRNTLAELRTGEIDSYRGYAITRLHHADNDFARVDYTINGFVSLIKRLLPDVDTGAMQRLAHKLEFGILLKVEELDACATVVNSVEDKLLDFTREQLKDAANTEMVKIELERLGMLEAA